MIHNFKNGSLVYCRFGEKYLTDLEKRKNSLISMTNQPHTNLASASYLINVKKYNTPDDIRNTHGLHELIMLLFCKGLDIKVLNKKELQFCKDVIAMNKLKFLKNGVCAI